MHAEVRIGDTVVMIADGGEGWPPAGAAPVQEPVKKDDADKRGGVKDAGGTTWWIATKVE